MLRLKGVVTMSGSYTVNISIPQMVRLKAQEAAEKAVGICISIPQMVRLKAIIFKDVTEICEFQFHKWCD